MLDIELQGLCTAATECPEHTASTNKIKTYKTSYNPVSLKKPKIFSITIKSSSKISFNDLPSRWNFHR